jgi:S-layer homology domain
MKSKTRTNTIGLICTSLLIILTGCSEKTFAPDPKLKEPSQTVTNTPINNTENNNPEVQLPTDFPQDIPIYQTAKLIRVETGNNDTPTKLIWESNDPSNLVESFYKQQLSQNNWQVDRPFNNTDNLDENILTASKNDLKVNVTVTNSGSATQLAIDYANSTTPTVPISPTPAITPTITPTPNASNTISFDDISQLPEQNRQYIQDLANLNILTPNSTKFEPNKPITRREYAKWLLTANNTIFANNASKQIRLATNASQPAFSDVKNNDNDFNIIQGLAESGIIPSSLSGDNNKQLFKPDALLTREDLIEWKVPLDIRKSLPTASLDNLKETWGFQDINKISPEVWRSLFADYQNGDRSNLKRTFGYTTLFQPKKTVTKAEAAATLWYFGDRNDGLSAKDALQVKGIKESNN